MNEIYWLTRLDSLETLFSVCAFLSLAVTILFLVGWFVTLGEEEDHKVCSDVLKKSIPILSISTLLLIFVPNTKQAIMIWGVGGTIDYIKSNETAKQLPDKCIQALDKFVDEYMLNKEDNKEK